MLNKNLINLVKENEGLRLKPYRCPAGKLTIGYGHNLDDNGITRLLANDLLHIDLEDASRDLFNAFPSYTELSEVRQNALIDMCYNLGIGGLRKFKLMHKALANKDFKEAAIQVLDSGYSKDVGLRATRNSIAIEEG